MSPAPSILGEDTVEDYLRVSAPPADVQKGELLPGPLRIYLIHSGYVRIYRHLDNGRQFTIDLAGPGDLFGFEITEGTTARAFSACKVWSWSADEIQGSIKREPGFGLAIARLVVSHEHRIIDQLADHHTFLIGNRLVQILSRLALRFGTFDGSWYRLMPITHEVLASMVGTSREIVTAYMNKLRRQNSLRFNRKEILIFGEFVQQHKPEFKRAH